MEVDPKSSTNSVLEYEYPESNFVWHEYKHEFQIWLDNDWLHHILRKNSDHLRV